MWEEDSCLVITLLDTDEEEAVFVEILGETLGNHNKAATQLLPVQRPESKMQISDAHQVGDHVDDTAK